MSLNFSDRLRNFSLVATCSTVAIIFAFLLFQLRVDLPAKNSLTLLWFLLSVGVEIWVIGVWNRLFG